MRLCFGNPTEDVIREGVRRLSEIMDLPKEEAQQFSSSAFKVASRLLEPRPTGITEYAMQDNHPPNPIYGLVRHSRRSVNDRFIPGAIR